MRFFRFLLLIPLFLLPSIVTGQPSPSTTGTSLVQPKLDGGKVYLVIGSDTGIWDGLDVADYHCTIGPTLYTDPTKNAARVMDPEFRGAMTDYFGTPMKLTWWLMAGNMFRLSVNTDVPTPSTMPVYLMNRYEGAGIRQWGDETTFHYHDWYWSDENGDGIWYWNQAPSFTIVADEFDRTLAELLLEEDLFPVSFRSGWHAMDNAWQRRLDEILPFSMHDDYPAVHVDPVEPVDNVYDWSRAPSTRIPFHPSTTDYQVPGDCRGWNLRSQYMSVADSAFMVNIFSKAAAGTDQVVCLWAHLPETDFPDNLQKVNRSAHAASTVFPTVQYRYCTAVEAMQRWLQTADTTKPQITLTELANGDSVGWQVSVNEPVFQLAPIVAVKDRYEDHRLLPMTKIGALQWRTARSILRTDLAEVAAAATDTSGNLATLHQRYLPADLYVDNGDAGYQELAGNWSTVSLKGWGAFYRTAAVTASDSAAVRWTANISSAGTYSIFLRIPSAAALSGVIRITATNGAAIVDTLLGAAAIRGDRWLHVATASLQPADPVIVTMTSRATGTQTLTADVMRITPLVRDKWVVAPERVEAGDFITGKQQTIQIAVENSGVTPATLISARTASLAGTVQGTFPRGIPAMSSVLVPVTLKWDQAGAVIDTLILATDDPRHPELRVVMSGRVREYFVIVDDRDSLAYQEYGGEWFTSVAQAYGGSSRCVYPTTPKSASFTAAIERSGRYQISEIVPTTVNASDRAKYVLRISGQPVDSVFVDQNQGSGAWVLLMTDDIPAGSEVRLTVYDAMSPVIAGRVLRADAVQFQWVGEMGSTGVEESGPVPVTTRLEQNYPNPFNPFTQIKYTVGGTRVEGRGMTSVKLVVYDLLGNEVAVLVNEAKQPGVYEAQLDGSSLASGVYIYRLSAGSIVESRKAVLLK